MERSSSFRVRRTSRAGSRASLAHLSDTRKVREACKGPSGEPLLPAADGGNTLGPPMFACAPFRPIVVWDICHAEADATMSLPLPPRNELSRHDRVAAALISAYVRELVTPDVAEALEPDRLPSGAVPAPGFAVSEQGASPGGAVLD